MEIIKFLKRVDQFGAKFQQNFTPQIKEYESCFGGIMSIFLYGLSAAYLIYILIQWSTGALLPKITIQSDMQSTYLLQFNDKFMEVGLHHYKYSQYDPFDPSAMIFQPLVYIFENGQPSNKPIIPSYQFLKQNNGFYHLIISDISLSINQDFTNEFPEYQYFLIFRLCQSDLLQSGQQCANQSQTDNFFAQGTNTIILKQYTQEFNTKTGKLDTIERETIFPFLQNKILYAVNYIQLTKILVDTGFLFESNTQYQCISEYRMNGVILDMNYFNDFFKYEMFMAFLYKLDNIQIQQTISYSKLSEILADAGSISSILLFFSNIVYIFNAIKLRFETIKTVITIYYPDFKNIKIVQNIFGTINQAELNGRKLDLKTFNLQFNKWSQICETKLSIANQIYEISRIQFLMKMLHPSIDWQNVHQFGIPLPTFFCLDENLNRLDLSQNPEAQQSKLNSIYPNELISKTNLMKIEIIHPQEDQALYRESDFYQIIIPQDEQTK